MVDVSSFGELRPESSTAYNFGGKYTDNQGIKASVNVFRNDIRDLIETQAVARKTNGQSVFSYQNLSKVFTQGAEIEVSKAIEINSQKFSFSSGYQYLDAKDKAVLEKIEAGKLYRRDAETLITERVSKKDYGGLMGRSRHSANFKVFYETKSGVSASLRGIYRSKYGFGDMNGNAVLDSENEYVKGFMTWNISAAKLYKKLNFQAGIDNLLNYKNPKYIANLAGRLAWVRLQFDF